MLFRSRVSTRPSSANARSPEPRTFVLPMWSSKPVPTEQPSLYECALGLKSCTGPSAMRVDQLPLLNTWPLFVLIGLVGAVVLWVLYSPSHTPPPARRPSMPKVSPKKDSDKEVDPSEPTRLIMVHTYLGFIYLIARGVVLDVMRLAVGLLPWNRAAAARENAAAAGAATFFASFFGAPPRASAVCRSSIRVPPLDVRRCCCVLRTLAASIPARSPRRTTVTWNNFIISFGC